MVISKYFDMLIIGSAALIKFFSIENRLPNDIDIICSLEEYSILKKELTPSKIIEKEKTISLLNIIPSINYPEISTKNVELFISDNSVSLTEYLKYDNAINGIKYASPEVLFSLKKSHIHFPIKFNKHIKDYNLLYVYLSGNDILDKITKINFKETEERVGKLKTPSLNKSVKKFFNQSNTYIKFYFIHDDLHIAMAHYENPLYQKMQYDLSLAKCEKELWDKFTHEEKCKCVLEEVYVIALERKILPMIFGNGDYYSSIDAMKWALMRVCTTLCSGWFREFATNYYFDIIKYYNEEFVELFLGKYDRGEIKRINNVIG